MASLIVAGDAVAADVAIGKKFCAGVIYNGTGTKEDAVTSLMIEYLVVGGGASGSHGTSGFCYGGGGGGGGCSAGELSLPAGEYVITVGDGGVAVTGSNHDGNNGEASNIIDGSLDTLAEAFGGGAGLANGTGGAAGLPRTYTGAPKSGIAGGGGAGAGGNGSGTSGGSGLLLDITGSYVVYGGGGGGSTDWVNGVPGGGGGAGAGGGTPGTVAGSGTANRGGGGGSCAAENSNPSGAGGSGVVILRYLTAGFGNCTGGTITTDGDYTVHSFTSSGTFAVVAP